MHFDVETAIKVLRQAGCYSHAVYLAEKHKHHEWYLKIQLEDIKVRPAWLFLDFSFGSRGCEERGEVGNVSLF